MCQNEPWEVIAVPMEVHSTQRVNHREGTILPYGSMGKGQGVPSPTIKQSYILKSRLINEYFEVVAALDS